MGGLGRPFSFAISWNIYETHRMKKFAILSVGAFAALVIQAQTIAKPATNENFRGLSTPSEKVVWASGTHGTYVKTIDGGQHWNVAQVPDSASLDFRDVQAFSAD